VVILKIPCALHPYWEDHPSGCMWLITIVNRSPKDRVVGPLPNGHFMAYKWE